MQRSISILVIILLFIIIILILGLTPIGRQPVAPSAPSSATSAAVASPNLTATASDQIIDLFQPSSDVLKQQLSASDISTQIENAMVVSYTLMHCNLMTQAEYSDTFNALITHALRSHLEPDTIRAEARVRAIASAAAGSYSMVYGNTPCTEPSLPDKATALKNWRTEILKPAAPAP